MGTPKVKDDGAPETLDTLLHRLEPIITGKDRPGATGDQAETVEEAVRRLKDNSERDPG